MDDSTTALIIQILPSLIVGTIYAALVFVVARKRAINPWPWTIGTLIPLFGLFVGAAFFYVTTLSILDRLNVLEGKAPSDAAQN